jgi:signal peptidase I
MPLNKNWTNWLKIILVLFFLILLIRRFFITPIVVDGPSMQPTLHNGDRVLMNKFSYIFDKPERFDVVVIHVNKNENYIKRIIGLPGEHIEYKDEVLYVNGEPIPEPFIRERVAKLSETGHYTHDFTLEDDIPGDFSVIPEGYVLVLGDNRSNSIDSRELGLVSYEQIIGEAIFIYWPLSHFGFVK